MNQKKLKIRDILLGKISRLCSIPHNIHKVCLLCKHMKCGLWVGVIFAVANCGNLQYYL